MYAIRSYYAPGSLVKTAQCDLTFGGCQRGDTVVKAGQCHLPAVIPKPRQQPGHHDGRVGGGPAEGAGMQILRRTAKRQFDTAEPAQAKPQVALLCRRLSYNFV